MRERVTSRSGPEELVDKTVRESQPGNGGAEQHDVLSPWAAATAVGDAFFDPSDTNVVAGSSGRSEGPMREHGGLAWSMPTVGTWHC